MGIYVDDDYVECLYVQGDCAGKNLAEITSRERLDGEVTLYGSIGQKSIKLEDESQLYNLKKDVSRNFGKTIVVLPKQQKS